MKRTIHIRQYFPFSQQQVWQVLTDADMLGKWFMQNDILPILGHEFTFRMKPQKGWDGITHCKITELQDRQKIAYTYRGEATGEKALACAGIHSETADKAAKGIFAALDTVLSFTLIPAVEGVDLVVQHSGFKGPKLVIVSLIMGMGWKKQMKKLSSLLDKIKQEKI